MFQSISTRLYTIKIFCGVRKPFVFLWRWRMTIFSFSFLLHFPQPSRRKENDFSSIIFYRAALRANNAKNVSKATWKIRWEKVDDSQHTNAMSKTNFKNLKPILEFGWHPLSSNAFGIEANAVSIIHRVMIVRYGLGQCCVCVSPSHRIAQLCENVLAIFVSFYYYQQALSSPYTHILLFGDPVCQFRDCAFIAKKKRQK